MADEEPLGERVKIIQHAYNIEQEDNFENSNRANLHLWCLDRKSHPCLIRILDFPVFCHIELPRFVDGSPVQWSNDNVFWIMDYLKKCLDREGDAPLGWSLVFKSTIYYYQGDQKTPMIFVSFPTIKAMQHCENLLKKVRHINNLGNVKLEMWETSISMVRKLFSVQGDHGSRGSS